MKNLYRIQNDEVIIYLKRKDNSFIETIIDLDDLPQVDKYDGSWYAKHDKRIDTFYVYGNFKKSNGKYTTIGMHRYIMDEPIGLLIDHKNHNGLDNRRNNLRLATQVENQQNIKGCRVNSLTKNLGVSFQKNRNKWQARIQVNKKDMYLGLFENKEDAVRAVFEARRKYMPFSKEASY